MNKFLIRALQALAVAVMLTGCAHDISSVKVGMTRLEVVQRMGEPVADFSQGTVEYLHYYVTKPEGTRLYYVKIEDGWVGSVGPVTASQQQSLTQPATNRTNAP